MTRFQKIFATLSKDILSPPHERRFEEARTRQPALAGYPTIASVLAALEHRDQQAFAEKEALVRAIIAELQAGGLCPHPGAPFTSLWSSVLLVACYPMLGNLRARIAGTELPSEDLDQLVVAAFLEVVSTFPLDRHLDRTFMRLRQKTQRQVFRHLAEHQRQEDLLWPTEMEVLEELGEPVWPEATSPNFPRQFARNYA